MIYKIFNEYLKGFKNLQAITNKAGPYDLPEK